MTLQLLQVLMVILNRVGIDSKEGRKWYLDHFDELMWGGYSDERMEEARVSLYRQGILKSDPNFDVLLKAQMEYWKEYDKPTWSKAIATTVGIGIGEAIRFSVVNGLISKSFSKEASKLTTQQELEAIAKNANGALSGNGPVIGTKKHTLFQIGVDKLNNSLLRTEVSFKNGVEVPRGTAGSVRLDVVEYNVDGTIKQVFDLKTGSASLTQQRIQQIQVNLPNLAPVSEIR